MAGCRIGMELYLKRILPDGAAIPANATELAELVWLMPASLLPLLRWTTMPLTHRRLSPGPLRTKLLPSNKTADASVSYWEVIQIWRKAQTLKN